MSAHTHGGLTYNSVSDAMHAHDRKGIGREGKGREGNRRVTSPSIVTQVTREAAPEQSVESGVEWMEGIDFEAEVPCDGPGCDHPAKFLVRGCGDKRHWAICQPHRRKSLSDPPRLCPVTHLPETTVEHFRIVEVLR